MASVIISGITPGSARGNISADANYRELEYVIVFETAVDSQDECLISPGVPQIGSIFPYNESLFCYNVEAKPEANNHKVWRVMAQYSPLTGLIVEGKAYDFKINTNPVEKVAKGAYSTFSPKTGSKGVDNFGKDNAIPSLPIQNSAGNPFDDPITVVDYNIVMQWWQIENKAIGAKVENGSIFNFMSTINLNDMTICGRGIPAYSAVMRNIQPEIFFYRPINSTLSEKRWKITYTIELSPRLWGDFILDQGFQALLKKSETDSTLIKRDIRIADLSYNSTKVKLNDANDKPVDDAVKLDGEGKILADDKDPVYLGFLVKKPLDWSTGLSLSAQIGY